jgi:hypothetical protein
MGGELTEMLADVYNRLHSISLNDSYLLIITTSYVVGYTSTAMLSLVHKYQQLDNIAL